MAQQSSFYFTDGATRTFPSTKHIASTQHVAVYFKSVATSTWSVIEQSMYDVVNQSVVFTTAPDNVLYSELEVRVADTATELTQSPSDIALVAGSIANVNTVSTSITNVNTVATNIATVNTVSGSIANVNTVAGSIANVNSVASNATNVNTVAGSIANVNSVATTVVPNIVEILAADDNAATATTQAGVATTQAGLSTTSATNAQLRAWEAEAERLTADSYATEAEDVVVKAYTSNGNGTFTATPTTEYSALHWAAKAVTNANFAPTVHAATSKTTPVDADEFPILDSAASFGLKKLTWANVVAALTSLFAPTNNPIFTGTISLEGATSNTFQTSLAAVDPTADNTVTIPNRSFTIAGTDEALITIGTEVASTSGTFIDFTGIPAGVKRITVMFNGVSTNGVSAILVQLGDSGGIENTGYLSNCNAVSSAGNGYISSVSGFVLYWDTATDILVNTTRISLISGTTYISEHRQIFTGRNVSGGGAGSKTLSSTLDRIRITTVNGTDTFDAGTINISWEF